MSSAMLWGNHKQLAKVKYCDEVRKYLNLSCDNLLFDEKNVYPNLRNKCIDVDKAIDDKTDKSTTDFENNAGEIKAKFKFDLRKYYEEEIKRLNHRMSLVRDVCLEKLVLISTLHDERIKFKHLLERMNDPAPKSKDPTPQSPLPKKMIDLETAQSKLPLLFPSSSTENVTKNSPLVTSLL